MARRGMHGITSGFITEICLVLAFISGIRAVASQPTTQSPTQHIHQGDQQDKCPDIQLPASGNGTCVLSDHCSKVLCTAPPDSGPFEKLTVQVYGCHQPLKAAVRLESSQSGMNWFHRFADGEEAAFPMPGIPNNMKVFLKVKLTKTNDLVHFKILQLFKSDFANYNVTFLEGDLHASKCAIARPITTGPPTRPITTGPPTKPPTHHNHEGDHQDICPVIRLPDDDNGTCILSDHCSKVTCTSPPDSTGPFGHMVLTVQTYGCRQPLQATVNLESYTDKESVTSGMKWSHTFEDGEKAELPIALPDAPANMKVFLKAELKKNGGNIHFKIVQLFESPVATDSVTFLEGDLHASNCANEGGSDHPKQCPAVNFLGHLGAPKKSCVYSDHCSRVACVAKGEGHKLALGFEVNRCKQSLTAKVSLKQPDDLDWSHILGDGEQAKFSAPPSSFTGGLPVSDASLFVKVKLQETQGNNVNFTVAIVGKVTVADETRPVNVVLLQGELPVSTDDCGSLFSRQSRGVKAAVIVVPIVIIVVILAVALVGFCWYKRRRDGSRFMVDIFSARDKSGMQRLDNEL